MVVGNQTMRMNSVFAVIVWLLCAGDCAQHIFLGRFRRLSNNEYEKKFLQDENRRPTDDTVLFRAIGISFLKNHNIPLPLNDWRIDKRLTGVSEQSIVETRNFHYRLRKFP
jgi:hypothetical protein